MENHPVIHCLASTMADRWPPLWNAVDGLGTSPGSLTCPDGEPSPIHMPHHHSNLLISTFCGESERHP